MKYKISVAREFVIDIESEALKKLETIYRNRDLDTNDVPLIEQACVDIEVATGIPVGDPGIELPDKDVIYAVAVAEDNYPIIEW